MGSWFAESESSESFLSHRRIFAKSLDSASNSSQKYATGHPNDEYEFRMPCAMVFQERGFIESFHAKSMSSRFLPSSSSSDERGIPPSSQVSRVSIAYASAAFTVSVKPIDRPLGISQSAQISIQPSNHASSSRAVIMLSFTAMDEDHSDHSVLLKPFAPI